MTKSTPVAWFANDGRLLRVFPSINKASERSGVSTTAIRDYMKRDNPNFKKPTYKDLVQNYHFELSLEDVNSELRFLMFQMNPDK